MAFVIQSGIPMVNTHRGRKPTEFPFDQMNVGDTFLIECDPTSKKEVESWRRKLLNAKKRFSENYDGTFTTAVVNTEEHGAGLRVWRTA
jgi:hypothetical protein